MDSIEALAKVYDSLSKGASTLDFSPSDITGDCAAQVQEIVRERKSGKPLEKAISSALSCMCDGDRLAYLGHISAGMGYWTNSIKAYEKALKDFEQLRDVRSAAQTYNNLGIVYKKMGEWNKAIEFYKKDLEISEKLEDAHGTAQTYVNLGLVYAEMGKWNKAIEFYQKSLETYEKLSDVHGAAQTYNNLGLVYVEMGEWNKAIEFYQKSLETYEKLSDVHGAAQTYVNLGSVYARMGEWNKAIEFYQKSLEILEKLRDVHGAAQTYVNLGLVYADMGKWNKAIEFYQKSLETLEKLGDVHGAAQIYNNLGSVYYRMGEWDKAIGFYQRSLETYKKLGDVHGAAQTYSNIGSAYADMGEWDKAIEFHQKSLETFEKLGDVHGVAKTYNNIGSVYYRMGEWDKAIEFHQKSLETFEKLGDIHGAAQTYNNLGSVYYRMGEWDKAIEFYQKSLETKEKLGDVQGAAHIYNNIGIVYKNMGEWTKATELYQKSLETYEKLGDVHGKGITLSNLGKLHLDKKPPEPEEARKYLKESIKLLNREARPQYPNALNWLALCYHKLGTRKKRKAKEDRKNQEELVKTSSIFFSRASELYRDVASLPRVALPSLKMYVHLDKGLSLSVMNVTEENDKNALKILDGALLEFRKALEFADEKEKIKLQGVISDHEAKRFIRLAAIEKNPDKQNIMLDKAIEALLNAASDFEKIGDACSNTCQGCSHLYQGLKLYRTGIRDKNNKALFDSAFELSEARKCYEKAENELGKDTVEVLSRSFKLVEEQIKSKDQIIVMKIAPEFIEIIEELSAVGLRKMVKMYTFDEGMNVKKEESSEDKRTIHIEKVQGNVIYTEGNSDIENVISQPASPEVPVESKSKPDKIDKIANPASIAAFLLSIIAGALLYFKYDQGLAAAISVMIGIIVFVLLAAFKLRMLRCK